MWNKIDTSGINGECWEWQGRRWFDGDKYGRIEIRTKDGCLIRTSPHRVVYLLTHGGKIPPRMCICHTCDNPPCCRPDHLWLGTYAENNQDARDKGRLIAARGEEHGLAKLTWKEVQAIRQQYAEGAKHYELAQEFGVNEANVGRIIRNEQWVVENPTWQRREPHWWGGRRGEDNNFSKLTQKDVDEIRERYSQGETQKALASAFNVTHGNISAIILNQTWTLEQPTVTSRGVEPRPGEDNPNAKLTWNAAWEIRRLAREGWTRSELAKVFQIGKTTANRIVRNESWVDASYIPPALVPRQERKAKLSQPQAAEIRRRYQAGEPPRKLAAAYSVGKSCIWAILLNKSWRTDERVQR